MKKLFLVDVSSLFFRAFYAVRPLTSPTGVPTNAVYGFLSMVTKLIKDENPEYLVFCYDRKEPSFRKGLFEEYKANRTEMPEDLVPQIPYIKKLAEVMGIPAFEVENFEADDIIGTLTKLGRQNKMAVYIVSGDKDFAQLIEPHVYMFDTMKDATIDDKGVKEKWGILPSQMIDYLALIGDSSDNVPGVRGIGPKGAQKLLEEYGTLEAIYKNIDQIKGSTQEKLKNGKADAEISKRLVTIVTDMDLPTDIETYRRKPFHQTELRALLEELNFKNFEKTIWGLDVGGEIVQKSARVESPQNEKTSEAVKKPNLETPTSSLTYQEIEILNLENILKGGMEVWGLLNGQGVFLRVENTVYRLQGVPSQLGILSDKKDLKWKGFDLKSFFHVIQPQKPNVIWDSMIASYVIKPGESMEWVQVASRALSEAVGEELEATKTFEMEEKVAHHLQSQLIEVGGEKIFQELDLPLVSILYRMEKRGIRLDQEVLSVQSKELAKDLHSLEKKIHEAAGEVFNVASPKQLAHILFDKLKLPPSKKTKTGFSTDTDVLEKLRKQTPIADLILSYRELAKLKSTYVDALPQLVKEDGRIHSHFNQALTMTGRLSSTDPNLQNIPIRTERGALVRKAFVANPGQFLLSVDYSQIELRILAHVSEDPALIRAFESDLDIHSATASEVFGVSVSEVTSDMRRTAKAVNFGIAYGQGAFGLAEVLGISRTEASEIIKKYFSRFSRVQNYIEDTIASAKSKGYVETLYGRKRYMDELKSKNAAIQKFGERAAINAPIQGAAADLVKAAMIQLESKVELPMLLQVHDELIFEGTEAELKKNQSVVVSIMENVAKLKVPLKANAAIGPNWQDAK